MRAVMYGKFNCIRLHVAQNLPHIEFLPKKFPVPSFWHFTFLLLVHVFSAQFMGVRNEVKTMPASSPLGLFPAAVGNNHHAGRAHLNHA